MDRSRGRRTTGSGTMGIWTVFSKWDTRSGTKETGAHVYQSRGRTATHMD